MTLSKDYLKAALAEARKSQGPVAVLAAKPAALADPVLAALPRDSSHVVLAYGDDSIFVVAEQNALFVAAGWPEIVSSGVGVPVIAMVPGNTQFYPMQPV